MNELVVHMEHKLILQGSLHLKVKYRDKARARRAVGLSFPGSAFASALTATSKNSLALVKYRVLACRLPGLELMP